MDVAVRHLWICKRDTPGSRTPQGGTWAKCSPWTRNVVRHTHKRRTQFNRTTGHALSITAPHYRGYSPPPVDLVRHGVRPQHGPFGSSAAEREAVPLLHHDSGDTQLGRAGEGDDRVNSNRGRKAEANGGYHGDRWDICGYSGIFKYALCLVGWPFHAHLVRRPSLVHVRISD